MSEYTTIAYNPERKKKGKGKLLKPIYKRINKDKLYLLVREYILLLKYKKTSFVFAEDVAKHFQVKKHQIKEAFKKLNQDGLLHRGNNKTPHDCRRATSFMDWGSDNSWLATIYYIRYRESNE